MSSNPVTVRLEEIVAVLLRATEGTGEQSTGMVLAAIALFLSRVAVVAGVPLDALLSAVETHYHINEACQRMAQQIDQATGQKPAGGCVN